MDNKNYVGVKQDLEDLLLLGKIQIKDDYVIWLEPDYKGVYKDIMILAGQFKLKVDKNGIYKI